MNRSAIAILILVLGLAAVMTLRIHDAESPRPTAPGQEQKQRRHLTLQYLALSTMDIQDRSFIKNILEQSLAQTKDSHTKAVIAFLFANEGEADKALVILQALPEPSLRNTFLYALGKSETLPLDWQSWVGKDWMGAKISGMIYRREGREREYAQTLTEQRFYENRAAVQQSVMTVASLLGYLGFGILLSMFFSNRMYRLAGKPFFQLSPLYFNHDTFASFAGGFFLALLAPVLLLSLFEGLVSDWALSSLAYLMTAALTCVLIQKKLFQPHHPGLLRTLGLAQLGFEPKNLLQILGGVAILVACLMSGASIGHLINWPFDGSEAFDNYRATLAGPISGTVLFVFACFIAPIFEELLFRGIFMRGLLGSTKPWLAITASALLFALTHSIDSWPFVFAMGAGLGIIYYRTGNLFVNMWVHAIYNGLTLILITQDLMLF